MNARRYTVPWVPSLRLHPNGEFGSSVLVALSAVVNIVYQRCEDGQRISMDEIARRVTVNNSPDNLLAVVVLAVEMELIVTTEVDPMAFRGVA